MAILGNGCAGDFEEINTNPNASTAASPQSLLAPALVTVINNNLNRNFRINNEFMQVTVTGSDSREFHRYEFRPSEADYMWRNWYVQLTNIRDIYTNAENTRQTGYETFKAISLILDVWVSSLLTDTYGNVPYSESNLGKEFNTTPIFDDQRNIYQSLFAKMEEANDLLRANINIPSNFAYSDPIYGGLAANWRKFGNSLYLRLLLRIAHKNDLGAQEKIREIVNENPAAYPLIANNEESAILRFSGVIPFITEFANYRDFDFNGSSGYSEFFINNLMDLEDPRLPLWATQASLGVYGGMQSGYRQGNVPDLQSRMQLTLKTEPLLGNILNYGELQFILAEAAVKNYISGDAQLYYANGVNASITLWGSTIGLDYFANPLVLFENEDPEEEKMKKIHLQKYFALMFTDFQQWFEYRRTRSLDLYIGPGLLNGGRMPVRVNYPIIVQSLNKANYDAAVAAMGGTDDINTKVWWERD